MFRINKSFLVHVVLGHSYLVYFASLIVGLIVDTIWPNHMTASFLIPIGFICLFLGPALIVWAQYTSHQLAVKQVTTNNATRTHDFYKGPYMFTRSPTHFGLFIMVIGVGFVFGSIAIIATTLIAFILTRTLFLSKEEAILEEKYGDEYREYKEKVRL